MLAPFDLLAMILVPLLLGMGILRLIGIQPRTDPLAYPGLAWILGSLGTALIVFAWLFSAPLPSGPDLPRIIALGLAVLFAWLGRRYVTPASPMPLRQVDSAERIFFGTVVALLLILVTLRIIEGDLLPVLVGDEADHWAMKTKLLWESGGFTSAWHSAMGDSTSIYHKDYPLLNPLLQIWVHLHGQEVLHVVSRLPIQIFNLAGLLVLASALRNVLRPAGAALFLCLAVAPAWSQILARTGDADYMVGLGALVAFVYAIRAHTTREAPWMRLSCLGLAFMIWSKNESLLYLASILAAAICWSCWHPRRSLQALRWHRSWLWFLAPLAMLALHVGFNQHFGIRSTFSNHEEGTLLELLFANLGENTPIVIDYFCSRILFEPSHSNYVFPLMLLMILSFRKQVMPNAALALPALTLLIAMAGIIAILIASPVDVHWLLATAAQRVSYQLYFCWIFWLALASSQLRVSPLLSPRPLGI